MRTTPFIDVLRAAFNAGSRAYDTTDTASLAMFTLAINARVREAWEHAEWPEWTQIEARAFADEYDDDLTYGLGDIVYDPTGNLYYTSLQAANHNNALTEAAWWANNPLTELVIPYAQTGKTVIGGRVWGVYTANPRQGKFKRMAWTLTPTGVEVKPVGRRVLDAYYPLNMASYLAAPGFVYLEYGLPRPVFSATHWDHEASYEAGDVVFYEGAESDPDGDFTLEGECYQYNGANWTLVGFPLILRDYVVNSAGADYCLLNGQETKAEALMQKAELKLNDEYIRQLGGTNKQIRFAGVY